MNTTADIVIIGGGVIGAACAHALSRHTSRIILIERRGLASGTSSACQSGVGHGLFAEGWDLSFDKAALDAYETISGQYPGIGYVKSGTLLLCTEKDAEIVRSQLPRLVKTGLDVEWLDAPELRREERHVAHSYTGATYLKSMGQVSPMRLVNEMAKSMVKRGGTILTDTEVSGFEIEGGRVAAVLTGAGRIATRAVVIAAGAWTRHVAGLAGIDAPVWPLKGHVLVTEPLPGLLSHYLTEAEYEIGAASFAKTQMTPEGPKPDGARTASVIQPMPSGQILLGSSREFAGFDLEVDRERLQQIAKLAARMVPVLGQRRIIRSYAGLRPWTPDGRPLIGRTKTVGGIILAAGHAGEGNTRSLATGRLVCEIMTGQQPHIDIRPVDPDRFLPSGS